MVKKYGQLYRETISRLRPSEGELAAQAARELLAMASGKEIAAVLAELELYASEKIEQTLGELTERYLAGCPLAYLSGSWVFYGLRFTVTPDVLIPRDDTLAVTELALEHLRGKDGTLRVLDLCTGSGCIGLAIAHALPRARVTIGDVSTAALRVAKQNIAGLGLSTRVNAFELDVLNPAPSFLGQFDGIVSNPPYVTSAEMLALEPSVRRFEPHLALDGGEDGLKFYRAIAANYAPLLKPGGVLCLEFGMGQEQAVAQILEDTGLRDFELRKDYRGVVRAICGSNKTNV